MYRINVLTSGKYNNVTKGVRYTPSKKEVKELIKIFTEEECNFNVEKLTRLTGLIFMWNDELPRDIERAMWGDFS